jgi:PAS domain-containing protein
VPVDGDRRRETRRLTEAEERRRISQAVREISTTIGKDFFESAAKQLALTLHADCVQIAELTEAPVVPIRTLGVVCRREDNLSWAFEQALPGTASDQVLRDGDFYCVRDARRRFPLDLLLETLDAEAYAGKRLGDSEGHTIGLIAAVFSRPAPSITVVKSVLDALQPRVAKELERRRATEALRENEQRYRAFIASNPDALWRIELEQPVPLHLTEEQQIDAIYLFGYLAECNASMARMWGAESPEALVGARFDDVAPRTDPRVLEGLRLAIRSGFRSATVETTAVDEQGLPVHRLRSQFGIVENGELRRIWGSTRDVTPLRHAELSLKTLEEAMRQMVGSLPSPAMMLDPKGKITFCNECFLQLTGSTEERLLGADWLTTFGPVEDQAPWKALLGADRPGQLPPSSPSAGNVLMQGSAPPGG